MKYTTMDTVFSKVQRDLPGAVINEVDIIEWAGEALEFINAVRAKEEAVAFLKVKNYQTELPYNLHNIIQIAKNEMVDNPDAKPLMDEKVDEKLNPDTDHPVCLDCNGMPYNDFDVAYYRPYHDLQYEYHLWQGNGTRARCYSPVRLTTHSFFNSLVCASPEGSDCGLDQEWANGLYNKSSYEYKVIKGKVLRFNFEKGIVAVAYLRNMNDPEGLPMIPDHVSFLTAITTYVILKQQTREFYSGREGAERRMQKADADWQWYCKQSSNAALIPQGVDELENIKDQRNYILPRRNVYSNYFGNLNNKEVKNILNTERRNNANYGRGTTR